MVAPAVSTALVDVGAVLDAPCRFLYKKELQQPSGSFKLRGMSRLVAQSIQDAKQLGKDDVHVFVSSGGNAGIAAAHASRHFDVPCTIALPVTAPEFALNILKSLGAEVVVKGAHWGEADAYLRETVMAAVPSNVFPLYCHPFDNATLWLGHADIIDDLAAQLAQLKVEKSKVKGIVCSCGGGGLYNGIVEGLRRNGLEKVPVLVMETVQTPSFFNSVEAGHPIVLPSIKTVSNSLGSPYITAQTWQNYNSHPTTVELLDDLDAVEATVDYLDKFGELVEPACGAAVAVSMKKRDLLKCFGPLERDDVVVFVVCGGTTVSPEQLAAFRDMVASRT